MYTHYSLKINSNYFVCPATFMSLVGMWKVIAYLLLLCISVG